ncbi:class I SAM-dependent DNA methyltransferase [Alteribacter aurantiacus]|uniref:class I SAM-dependent DNA methyltransferase n=1 Tax=Alteribacter aurantiacus TaxID=254410 RepID=UPI00040DD579|nr:DNA methyltransferase [Alteribacter aurantiacus]
MAMLSWNEIRVRAIRFAKEWQDETSENAEAKTFWDEFFNVFGISRRRTASFEKKVKTLGGKSGYIDLLWKGVLLVEHKSRGKDLERAYKQAKDYFPGLKESELPKYILVSDFENFALYDLDTDSKRIFTLEKFPQNIELFGFIAGYQQQEIKEQDPVNVEAAEKMGELHDKLKEIGYGGSDLEVYLVRLLFCLFADDTGIYEKNLFRDYIEHHTKEDGSDLAGTIELIFEVLNTPVEERLANIDETLDKFPYVNGGLFSKRLRLAYFDSEMREMLLESSALDWGRISPAIFGSLFQSVMDSEERRSLGAHYTNEENILKVINPLFLEDLWKEFKKAKRSQKQLELFHEKIASLKFLDPACGCGNFLIIAYRELRLLEMEVIRELLRGKMVLKIDLWVKVNVDQFYGVEINEFATQVAQLAMWLIDHQMNMAISEEFGQYFVRLPLTTKPNIIYGNALRMDWKEDIVSPERLHFILGNPPFVGTAYMSKEQKEDITPIVKPIKAAGGLDYVTAWYIKAADFIEGTDISVAFVSTNSIVQGLQAIVLWKYLMHKKAILINFAHQTFKWSSEAKGKAAVYCVIIGFSRRSESKKMLFTYPNVSGPATMISANNINHYLLDAPTIFIKRRRKPICDVKEILYGTKPADGGYYLFNLEEKEEFIKKEPNSAKYFREWVGSKELINSRKRYVLYLRNCPPGVLRKMPLVRERVEEVRKVRLASTKHATKKWADFPTQFTEDRVIEDDILAIPEVSSENRSIIPIAYFKKGTICSNKIYQLSSGDLYLFGILTSAMHNAWTKTVCGRLENRISYSSTVVYNNFIFPTENEKIRNTIEKRANDVLSIREKYEKMGSTLADLYDPIVMPVDLVKAHRSLDKAVDKAYGKSFKNDNERVEHLFKLYLDKVNDI